VTRIEE